MFATEPPLAQNTHQTVLYQSPQKLNRRARGQPAHPPGSGEVDNWKPLVDTVLTLLIGWPIWGSG